MRHYMPSAIAATCLVGQMVVCADGELNLQLETKNARAIAEEWRYDGDGVKRNNREMSWVGISPPEHPSDIHTQWGSLRNVGSFESAWSYYATRCGITLSYKGELRAVSEEAHGDGVYTLLDRRLAGRRAATFGLRRPTYSLSVVLIEATSEELQVSMTVSMR